jgi:hypothetical protein
MSQGLVGSEPGQARGVMNSRPVLAVFLIIEVEGKGFGEGKLGKWGGVGQHQPILAVCDILHAKLYSSSPNIATRHGVFTDLKKKEKPNRNKVGSGSSEQIVWGLMVSTGSFDCEYQQCELWFWGWVHLFVAFQEVME